MNFRLLPFTTLAGLGLALAGCSGAKADGDVLATVNNEKISMDEFHRYLERKQSVTVSFPDKTQNELPVVGSLGLQAMRDLINRRILLQIAKDDGVMPTDADITQELAFQTKARTDFVKLLQQKGLTMDQIRSDITLDLARERILGKGIEVTMNDVDKYIKENPQQFTTPPLVQMYYIVVRKDEQKRDVDRDLQEGQTFKVCAQRYSLAPNAKQLEGRYPIENLQEMSPALRELVKKTPELTPTAWLKDGQNWVRFYIEKKIPAQKQEINDLRKQAIQRQLRMVRGAEGVDLGKRLQAKLRNSKVVVELKHLQQPWQQAFDALKSDEAQKADDAAGSATRQ